MLPVNSESSPPDCAESKRCNVLLDEVKMEKLAQTMIADFNYYGECLVQNSKKKERAIKVLLSVVNNFLALGTKQGQEPVLISHSILARWIFYLSVLQWPLRS